MVKNFLWVILFFSNINLHAQQSFTIHGYITDSLSGEALPNAHLMLKNTTLGTATNRYGFYSLSLNEGHNEIMISVLGYFSKTVDINLQQDLNLDISLIPQTYLLDEIVFSQEEKILVSEPENHLYKISPTKIRELPQLAGEPDPMKALQSIPGIQQGSEGGSGLHVRGGSPDQNLILIDGIPIYNVYHLFGFLSIVNSESLKDITVYKDGFPAYYEGRLSSIIDFSLREGNLKEGKASLSISPLAGNFMYETPIKKDKSSVIISARRSWLDGLYSLLSKNQSNKTVFNFYDVSAKYYSKINDRNTFYLSYYSSRDKFGSKFQDGDEKSVNGFNWQNHTGLIRWNNILNKKTFINNFISFSDYSFNQKDEFQNGDQIQSRRIKSFIRDINLNSIFNFFPSPKETLIFGLSTNYQNFQPEAVQNNSRVIKLSNDNESMEHRIAANIFTQYNFELSDNLKIRSGLRLSYLSSDQTIYFQPRVSVSYNLAKRLLLRTSYDHVAQNLHLLTNTSIGQPTDMWVPSTIDFPSETAHQFSIAIAKSIPNDIVIDLNAYYKVLNNLIEYREGSNFLFGIEDAWKDKITSGSGRSKGIEALIIKNSGKINGWISYTFSKAERQFNEISNGRPFPYKYDRRHNLSTSAFYEFSRNKKLSLSFIFNSGHAFTLPTAKIATALPPGGEYINSPYIDIASVEYINIRNNQRMPDYHRMDISYQTTKRKKKYTRTWTFSVYNLYSQLNPYFIYERQGKLVQYSLFPIIPSVAYRIEFNL